MSNVAFSVAQRGLYFLLGAAVGCAVLAFYTDHESIKQYVISLFPPSTPVAAPLKLTAADLVGTWKGKESWGSTYTIIRRKDGTFWEFYDRSQADVPSKPAKFRSKGYWSLTEKSRYAYFYTQSSCPSSLANRGPFIRDLSVISSTEISYQEEEGNGVLEKKL